MAASKFTETERKYEVDDAATLPALSSLGATRAGEPATLRAVYYDTADAVLASHLITLRRREGGTDEGWHVKFPGRDGRTEYHSPLGAASDGVPSDLLDLVAVHTRGRDLVEIARITTQRSTLLLLNDADEPVVEVVDDLVSATDTQTGILRIWREWEAELCPAAPTAPGERTALLDRVEAELVAVGAAVATSKSKLAQATGRRSLAPVEAPPAAAATTSGAASDAIALEIVLRVLFALVSDLIAADPRVRADEPGAVHSMRIVVRRLRGTLAAFRGVLDRSIVDDIRDRLRQLGDVLGSVRDAEVRREYASSLVADEPDANIRRRLIDDVGGEYGVLLAEAQHYLNGADYFALLDDLERLVQRPPLAPQSLAPAREVLHHSLRRQFRRARRRAKAAQHGQDLASLHSARKAARRLRYVAESLSDGTGKILGKKARKLAVAAEKAQNEIGEHRDASLFMDRLAETEREAQEAGENTLGYVPLTQTEHGRVQEAAERADRAIAKLVRAPRP